MSALHLLWSENNLIMLLITWLIFAAIVIVFLLLILVPIQAVRVWTSRWDNNEYAPVENVLLGPLHNM